MNYGKIPPQAPELEIAVLGAIMLEPSVIEKIGTIIQPDDFYVPANILIFKACLILINNGSRIDIMTVCEKLKKDGELDLVGGIYYVTSLTRDVVSSAHVEEHARLLKEYSIKRQIIKVGMEMVKAGYEPQTDAFQLHDEMVDKVSDIISGINRSKIELIGNVMKKAIQESYDRNQNGIDFIGYRTGIKSLDRLIGGFAPSDFIIIAGGTGEGKSTLALNIANSIANEGIPTAFFTLEMQSKQLAYKILSEETESTIKSLRLGNLTENKWKQLFEQQVKYANIPLYLNDAVGLNISELCSIIRALVKNKGVKIAFIDYLQLIKSGVKVGIREQEVNYISKELRTLALELDIPIVALSQLSRIEKGTSRLYQLSDLRESGAIEQDATNVIFIYKPILPNQNRYIQELTVEGYGKFETTIDDTLIISAKNRNDATGAIRVKEQFYASRFVDYEEPAHVTKDIFKVVTSEKIKDEDKKTNTTQFINDLPF